MSITLATELQRISSRLERIAIELSGQLEISERPPPIDLILDVVCQHYHMPVKSVLGPRRSILMVLPRHVVMYLCRELTNRSFPVIGRKLRRDHTSIMHGAKKIEQMLLDGDSELQQTIEKLKLVIQFRHSAVPSPALLGSAPAISPSTDTPAGVEPQLLNGR